MTRGVNGDWGVNATVQIDVMGEVDVLGHKVDGSGLGLAVGGAGVVAGRATSGAAHRDATARGA